MFYARTIDSGGPVDSQRVFLVSLLVLLFLLFINFILCGVWLQRNCGKWGWILPDTY